MAVAIKGRVEFIEARCKACSLCVEVCPVHILAIGEGINQGGYHPAYCIDQEKCIACKSCSTICPDCVITVYKL